MQFIGQKNLFNKIDTYDLINLPKTMLFIGPCGCGKKTVIEYLRAKFNFELVVLDENVTQDQLIEFSQRTVNTIYRIDLANFNERLQNQFLKFIEEPSISSYVMLTADSEIGVLPTILNRCVKFVFEPYTQEELKVFFNSTNPLVYEICKTPGSLTNISQKLFDSLLSTCSSLCELAKTMSLPKILAVSGLVNCKDIYDKYDFDLFFEAMSYVSYSRYKATNDETSFNIYLLTNRFRRSRINKNIIKDNFLTNYLTQLYEVSR